MLGKVAAQVANWYDFLSRKGQIAVSVMISFKPVLCTPVELSAIT